MSKCGKGCMPKCEYFTTGGCISPFNCMYKEESGYINSATSGKIFYTGGMNMTNEEMIENLKCVIADISKQCEQLKAENAELRARLEKAVELPCKLGGAVYSVRWSKDNPKDGIVVEECVGRIEVDSSAGFVIHTIEYEPLPSFSIYYNVDWNDTVFATRAEAEARLKELRGGER